MAILEMKNISKHFSGVYANKNVNLSVEKGEIHALLGENGAGKTTLMNILFGINKADGGEIFWKERPVHFESPKEAIAEGIGMVHQHFSLVERLTVLDNMILGLTDQGVFLDRKRARERIDALAEKYGLKVDPATRISTLSVGQQQRVEILKALYRNVELLILDEPTGVLTPQETEHFFKVLKKLKEEGYAIIIITHRMSEIMSISDRVSILRDGRLVKALVTAQTNPEELSHYMIGRTLDNSVKKREQNTLAAALKVAGVRLKKSRKRILLEDISFDIRPGEVLGIAGVDGNGQKELSELVAGVRKPTEGTLSFLGEDITLLGTRQRFKRGITYITDDRHADGLVLAMNVEENLMLRQFNQQPFSSKKILNHKKIQAHANEMIEKYRIKTSGTTKGETAVRLMSGGNQQKIIIAREAGDSARLIIANQPTRGLDIGATQFVRQVLIEHRNLGHSVMLISADLEEIMALSDRIAVMFGGRIVGVLDRADATRQKLGLLMGGIKEVAADE